MAHRTSRIVSGGALAVVGGFLIAVGGVTDHSFLLPLIHLLRPHLGEFMTGIPLFVVLGAVYLVSLLVGLGGVTVVVGGLLIFARHTGTGRLLIALGGGAGLLGLALSFGYTAFTMGVSTALGHSAYWIGLIMSVLARRVARKA